MGERKCRTGHRVRRTNGYAEEERRGETEKMASQGLILRATLYGKSQQKSVARAAYQNKPHSKSALAQAFDTSAFAPVA